MQRNDNTYCIQERDINLPPLNYLFNESYLATLNHLAQGTSFYRSEDGTVFPVCSQRNVYISDGERFWHATGLPVDKNVQAYQCKLADGYSDIILKNNGIASKCRFFVAPTGNREFLKITVRNDSKQTKTLKIIPCYSPADDLMYAHFDDDKNCVIASDFNRATYLLAYDTATGFDTRACAFFGQYGNSTSPQALLSQKCCLNSQAFAENCCLALENTVTLSPDEIKSFYYTFGTEKDIEQIPLLLPAEMEALLSEVSQAHKHNSDQIRIHTPYEGLNTLINSRIKYDTNLLSLWSNNIEGFYRNAVFAQQTLSLTDTKLAAKRLITAFSKQYEAGGAPTFFNLSSKKQTPDSALWLIFAAHTLVKEMGDVDYLLTRVPFANGDLATIYEHCKRALQYLWGHTGLEGLLRIDDGDITTELDCVGTKGKGISVWLSEAFVLAAKRFSEMANWIGSEGDSKTACHYAREMEGRINRYAWKADRYIYAISDEKQLIGAKDCPKGAIFALPQIWSVIADFSDRERCENAMDIVERHLITEKGLLNCTPAFTNFQPYLGKISNNPAGVGENGTVLLIPQIAKLAADALLHRNDKIDEGLRTLLPQVEKVCPMSLCDGFFGDDTEHRAGQPLNNSIPSAAAPALLYTLVYFIFGLHPEFGGLIIRPVLPPAWRDCSITKNFRDCRYNVHFVQRDKGCCNTIDSIYVNGMPVNPRLPIRPQKGKVLDIEVILKA